MKESLMQCPKEVLCVDAHSVPDLGRNIKDYPDKGSNFIPDYRKKNFLLGEIWIIFNLSKLSDHTSLF